MQENNHFSGVNLSLFKTGPDILKIESANVPFHANPNTSPNAQREQICIFTNFPDVPWSAQPLGGCSISQNCRFFVKDNTQAAKMCLIDL